jgi:hypothetical protein
MGRESGLAERKRFGRMAAHEEQASQMAARFVALMCLAARFLVNRQRADLRPLDERLVANRSRRQVGRSRMSSTLPAAGRRGAVQSQTWMRGLYQIPRYPSQTGAPRVQ